MRIPREQLERGAIYRLRSHNLNFGVFNGEDRFVGIREKFGRYRLDSEVLVDEGPPFGTASALEKVGAVPEGIEIRELSGRRDQKTGRWVDRDPKERDGRKGWFFLDTGEPAPDADPAWVRNEALYEFLLPLEPYTAEEVKEMFLQSQWGSDEDAEG